MSSLDRPVTLVPGRTGTLLTEVAGGDDAPLQIINRSDQLAWIGSDSGVGPSNGVPLDGGTSLPWTTPGQVWAVADVAAIGPVTVVASTSISDWTPSPYAIAAATAARLLATGIPSVLVTETVLDFVTIPIGGSIDANVAGYASLIIGSGQFGAILRVTQRVTIGVDGDSGDEIAISNDLIVMPTIVVGGIGQPSSVTLQCRGDSITIDNLTGGTPVQIFMVGTNRTVERRIDGSFGNDLIDVWNIGSTAMLANNQVAMTHQSPAVVAEGDCMMLAALGNAAVTSAAIVMGDLDDNDVYIAEIGEPGTYTRTINNTTYVSKRVFVPHGAKFKYVAFVAGTIGPYMRLTQCS